MVCFYEEVNNRIQSIKTFEETIKRIDELNILILEALKERSKYPICKEFFENTPQKELIAKGVDPIQWGPLYSRIIGKICQEGEFIEGVTEAEGKLEKLIHERIFIGKNIVKYKAPRGLPITRKDREERIIEHVREYSSQKGMNPDAIEYIFRELIERNKHIQNLSTTSEKEELKEIEKRRTQVPEFVEIMEKDLKFRAQKLTQETGKKYFVKTEIIGDLKHSPHYITTLVED